MDIEKDGSFKHVLQFGVHIKKIKRQNLEN